MSRLRNRMVKAEFWTDPELLRWPLPKRVFYQGLWALAEDSGCLEDDAFGWKLQLFPSPADSDITLEALTAWRDELVEAGKLVPYEVGGKRYLYLRTFHRHESPRNPQRPDLPLPPWVEVTGSDGTSKDGKRWLRCRYEVHEDLLGEHLGVCTESVQTPNGHCTESVGGPPSRPVPSRPVPSRPVPSRPIRALAEAGAPAGAETVLADDPDDAFAEWWAEYGRVGSKADAERLYRFWRGKGAERADLLRAARVYRDHCTATDCKMQHARTFLAKPPKGARARWYEWAEGEQHGSMDARGDRRLMDVMTTAAEAFGLNGGNDNGNGGRKALGGGPTRAAEGRSDVGGGMAARELGAGE